MTFPFQCSHDHDNLKSRRRAGGAEAEPGHGATVTYPGWRPGPGLGSSDSKSKVSSPARSWECRSVASASFDPEVQVTGAGLPVIVTVWWAAGASGLGPDPASPCDANPIDTGKRGWD